MQKKRILSIDFYTKNSFAHIKLEIHLLGLSVDSKLYFCKKMRNVESLYPEISKSHKRDKMIDDHQTENIFGTFPVQTQMKTTKTWTDLEITVCQIEQMM